MTTPFDIVDAPSDPLARALASRTDLAYMLLRVTAGLLFAFHGAQKLFGWFMPFDIAVGSQAWIGGLIELVTGLAIAGGVRTTWAAFLASGTMAVAYIQFHWRLDLGAKLLPAVNQGELALIYSLLFLYIACRSSAGRCGLVAARDGRCPPHDRSDLAHRVRAVDRRARPHDA